MTVNKFSLVLCIGALLALNGCVSLNSQAELVEIVDVKQEVAACENIGEVSAEPPFVGPNDAKNTLRNKAAELGGNAILMNS